MPGSAAFQASFVRGNSSSLVAFGLPIAVSANHGGTPHYAESPKRTRPKIPVPRVTGTTSFNHAATLWLKSHNNWNMRKGGTLCRNTV